MLLDSAKSTLPDGPFPMTVGFGAGYRTIGYQVDGSSLGFCSIQSSSAETLVMLDVRNIPLAGTM